MRFGLHGRIGSLATVPALLWHPASVQYQYSPSMRIMLEQ